MVEKVREQAAQLASGEKFRGLLTRLGEGIRGLGRRLRVLSGDWEEKLWAPLPRGIREGLPWLKGKLVCILTVLILALPVAAILAAGRAGPPAVDGPGAGTVTVQPVPVPPEELFLPEEPDFLPPVILERPRREAWTVEDAEAHWYNPLEQGEEAWRERVEQVIEELLERVP
jgi:hypothetical protein